eukprot:8395596-Pyramimonas_sp.AAC.1
MVPRSIARAPRQRGARPARAIFQRRQRPREFSAASVAGPAPLGQRAFPSIFGGADRRAAR